MTAGKNDLLQQCMIFLYTDDFPMENRTFHLAEGGGASQSRVRRQESPASASMNLRYTYM